MYLTLKIYCNCGAQLTGTHDARLARRIEKEFWWQHNGPDCKPSDAETAGRNRRRQEQRKIK